MGSRKNPDIDLGKSPIGRAWDLRTSWTEEEGLESGELGRRAVEFGIEFVGFVVEKVIRRRERSGREKREKLDEDMIGFG